MRFKLQESIPFASSLPGQSIDAISLTDNLNLFDPGTMLLGLLGDFRALLSSISSLFKLFRCQASAFASGDFLLKSSFGMNSETFKDSFRYPEGKVANAKTCPTNVKRGVGTQHSSAGVP